MLKKLKSVDNNIKTICLLIMTFWGMYFIGGSLLSIGSVVDRIVWLSIGYLAIIPVKNYSVRI
jgi:hypothetical protein